MYLYVCLINNVSRLGEIDAYRSYTFLYWSGVRLCINAASVYWKYL